MSNIFLYDESGYKAFRIIVEDTNEYKDTSFGAEVFEVTAWEGDSENTPAEEELYLTCYIKWDSCSHFYFGEKGENGNQDGYLHICGAEYFKRHIDLMGYLYKLAFKEMGRDPYDESEAWETKLMYLKEEK